MDQQPRRYHQRYRIETRKMSITLAMTLYDALDALSRRDGLSISGHIARAVEAYIKRSDAEIEREVVA